MSLYSSLSSKIMLDNIKCQYDMENEIADSSNQCSWYVYCVIDNLKKNNWIIPSEISDLEKLHTESLVTASILRKKNKKLLCGESIFSKTIQSFFDLNIGSPSAVHIGYCDDNNYLITKEMHNVIEFKKKLPKYSSSELYKKLCELFTIKSYLLVNRHGQSFLIFPHDSSLIIFDSHVRQLGTFTTINAYKYILNNSDNNLIVFINGYMNNDKLKYTIQFDDTGI